MQRAALVLPPGARGGNRVTALRWARVLRRLGWGTFLTTGWPCRPFDLLVALHAGHSRAVIERCRRQCAGVPVIVACTGTDLYVDLPGGGERARSVLQGLRLADRLIVLQERALDALPAELRTRAHVVHQSLPATSERPAPDPDVFEICLLAHLRPVKDPLLGARATRHLPQDSRLRLLHLGSALDPESCAAAEREARDNPRYRWLGERSRRDSLCLLARSRLMLSTSLQEGGANVVSEALALDVPVLATAVEGTLGLLGAEHPGLFAPGDALALAALLERAEGEPEFLERLAASGRERAWTTDPARERSAWEELLAGLFPDPYPGCA